MGKLLIHNCNVLQCEQTAVRILKKFDILIDGKHISSLGPSGTVAAEGCREVMDARGMVAMPGLINTHAHVPMVIFRGLAEDVNLETWFNDYMWPLENNLQPEDVYWGMLLGVAEMIESGVTAVADHYFHMDRAAEAVEAAGIRGALGWAVFGNQGLSALKKTASFVREYHGAADGRITTWMAPHAPYTCDEHFLSAAADWAGKLNAGIHIHASETMLQTQQSLQKTGATPLQILERNGILDHPCIIAHGCGLTDSDIDILKTHGSGIAHAPKTYLKLAMGNTPVTKLLQAGVPVGLATDGAVSNNTLDIWESMRLMAMLQKQDTGNPETMSVAETLWVTTRGSAAVYGLPDNIGHIAPGFFADIILVDMNGLHNQPLHSISANLVYSTRPADVHTVIVDGKIIMKDRILLTLHKKEIIDHVRFSMERLSKRIPGQRIQTYNP